MAKFFFGIVAALAMAIFFIGYIGGLVYFVSEWRMVLEFFINSFVVSFLIGIYNVFCFKLRLAFQMGVPFLAGFIFHALYRYFYYDGQFLFQISSIVFGFAFFHLLKAIYKYFFVKN